MEIIQFKNVNFTYPACEKPALKDINLSVGSSEFVVLCGKSGCGKSTLLRHLKKSLMPYGKLEGSILYQGTEIDKVSKRESASKVGFVSQSPDNQIVTDKVWHELAFGPESLGMDNLTIKRHVAEMASFFGIQTWFRKSVNELSGGQKQILNLASVMVMKPKVLILDEPTSQLDPISASEFIATLKKINQELGTTVIISEHRLEELFSMADRVLVMDEGRIVIDDTPKKALLRMYSERMEDMLCFLPSASKIAGALGETEDFPLDVRRGRQWLRERVGAPKEEFDTQPKHESTSLFTKKNKSKDGLAISMKEVWFRYDKIGDDILRNLDLDVKRGEVFALLGGNGVGKTTMLKILTKTLKADRGKVKIMGTEMNKLSDREFFSMGISLLPQNPQALFTETSAYDELAEALCYEKLSDSEKDEKVCKMLCQMELEHLRDAHPYDLSGGEQQRLALGKLLLTEPDILLLDEPTKGIDPVFKDTLGKIFKKLSENGVTILMVTHDIEFASYHADRCALFFDGTIVSASEPKEFFGGNRFYTTSANRIAGDWFPRAITWEEVAENAKEL